MSGRFSGSVWQLPMPHYPTKAPLILGQVRSPIRIVKLEPLKIISSSTVWVAENVAGNSIENRMKINGGVGSITSRSRLFSICSRPFRLRFSVNSKKCILGVSSRGPGRFMQVLWSVEDRCRTWVTCMEINVVCASDVTFPSFDCIFFSKLISLLAV